MCNILPTAFAAATILSVGMLGTPANAMTLAPASALGAARADTALVHQATVICGNNGCVPVQTKRVEHAKKISNIR
jgi:hypothetical protein